MTAQRNPREPIALTDHHSIYADNVRLRNRLAGSERARALLSHDLDAAYAELRRERLERRRLEGLTRSTPRRRAEWLTVALGGAADVWDELTAPQHRGWAIFALGVGGLFLAIVAMGGQW